jgi:DNA polymerase III subunit epsilon
MNGTIPVRAAKINAGWRCKYAPDSVHLPSMIAIPADPAITRRGTSPYEGRMKERYAVLDVETTSGDPCLGRVIEVAVLAFDGALERLRWDSLVDPGMSIPPFIRRLTGMDDAMLQDAPVFAEVARSLSTITQDRIIVAHNVRYDITALEYEFARTGLCFVRSTLCTEKLCRQLLPGLTHYNLGSLCRYFGIPFTAWHRATPDAQATAALFFRLQQEFGEDRLLTGVHMPVRAIRA